MRAHANRIAAYVIAYTAAALLVATISPRFLACGEPWAFFVLGISAGVPVAAVVVAIGLLPAIPISNRIVVVVGMVATGAGVFALVDQLFPEVTLSVVGLVFLVLVGTAFGWLVYLVGEDVDVNAPPV